MAAAAKEGRAVQAPCKHVIVPRGPSSRISGVDGITSPMVEPASSYVTYEEYLEGEQKSDTKREWLDGVVYAMAGGTLEHSPLAQNMGRCLEDITLRL